MTSILRLNRPCPCGSGKTYRECCAPKKKKKGRRKKRTKAGAGKTSDGKKSLRKLEEFDAQYAEFDAAFASLYNQAAQIEREEHGDNAFGELFRYLEITPGGRQLSPAASLLFTIYFIFRMPFDEAKRERQRERLTANDGKRAARTFAQFDRARFGAWRVSEAGPTGAQVRRIDGQKSGVEQPIAEQPIAKQVVSAVIDGEHSLLEPRRPVVGWLIDIGEEAALSFCVELDRDVSDKLTGAAERQAWGSGANFRQRDYEDDVVALLVRPSCVDTGDNEGRVFLHEIIHSHHGLAPHNLQSDIATWIENEGLDATIDEALDSAWDRSRNWWAYDEPEPSSMWSLTAASATEETLDELIELLRGYRHESVPSSVRWEAPIGDRTLESIISTDELLAMVALEPDASIDHPTVRGALAFPMVVLAIEQSDFRRAGFDLQWSVQQGLSWARQNASAELVELLEDAVAAHRLAIRWVGIVTQTLRYGGARPRIIYDELVCGFRKLLPPSAGQVRLDALDDPGRGSWARIEKAMRAEGMLDGGEPLRLADLPEYDWDLLALDGVGDTSVQNLIIALYRFVAEWPASEGHLPTTKSAAQADEAADELSSGLDDLDELF
jgi:hypothetical protein